MSCERIEGLISEQIDGEISPEDVRILEEHLESCDRCRSLAAACRDQNAEIREAFAERVRTAGELAERCASVFHAVPASGRSWRSSALAVAAALLIGFGLGWLTLRSLSDDGGDPGSKLAEDSPEVESPEGGTPEAEAPRADSPEVDARLAFATGPVEMLSPGAAEWREIRQQDPIPPQAKVRCGPAVLCELHVDDGSVVRLGEGAEVTFANVRQWELNRGRMWTHVARSNAVDPFQVSFDGTKVTALGTRFEVHRRDVGPSVVQVYEGSTKVVRGDQMRVVRRGERAEISDELRVRKLRDQLRSATAWMDKLLVVEGRNDAELARRLEELLAGVGAQKMAVLFDRDIRNLGTSCVAPLLGYIRSPLSVADPAKRRGAADIIGDLATEDFLDDLIDLLSDQDGYVRSRAASALARLTGTDLGLAPDRWGRAEWSECEPTFLRWVEWSSARKGGKS